MKEIVKKKLIAYLVRFSLVHLITYSIVATVFLVYQNSLPETARIALDFFEPYRQVDFILLINEFIKGILIALILYPFYEKITTTKHGWIIIFMAVWGIALLGSVSPMPGSLEGLVYTTTTLTEHVMVLSAGVIQAFLLSIIFLYWEKRATQGRIDIITKINENDSRLWKYTGKFVVIHILTYVVVGFTFYNLQNYASALDTMEAFKLYRNLEDPMVAASVLPAQVIRGTILAIFIYPFYDIFIKKKRGWLLLFTVLYGFTFGVLLLPDFLETITTGFSLEDILIGPMEVSAQMIIFSFLFFKWAKKKA